MPSHAAANPNIKQLYINGHFCYVFKFGIITNGLGKSADCEGVKVAGYFNTTMTGNNNYTLDFYAYFPYDKPAYVVVVRMKKKGLPASAGGMCASVVRRIVPDICKQIH